MDYNFLKKALLDKYFGFLNNMQREAVYTTEGPLLVLAGAGSGKTTVIVNRIANIVLFGRAATDKAVPENADMLIAPMKSALASGKPEYIREILKKCAVEPAAPYRVLCITFTNKAAREFKERLNLTLGEKANDIWAGTFHSVCVRILRRHIDLLGYQSSFTIYDTDDCKKLITDILKEKNISESVLPPRTAMNTISRAKECDRTPRDELLDAGKDRLAYNIARVYEAYQDRLKAANALDFDDIIMLTNRLFDSHPEILDRYREHFQYILVDEYQDTNPSQSRLVSLLAGKKRNVCVVGDDDQSIYSFRGATVENILGFDSEYANAKIIRLEQNYRSVGNILEAANGIIQNNLSRKGKELWTEAEDGEKIHIPQLETQLEEAQFICDTIADKVKRGAKYSDFAVLYRVNALSNSLETAFVKARMPYKIFGGLRFYERREIKDILAYLSVIANPADSVRLRRIINLPKRGIGETTIERLAAIADEQNVDMITVAANASRYPELSRAAQKLVSFALLIEKLREFSKTNRLPETVSYVIEQSGYKVMLAEEENGQEREENVLELVSTARLFAESSETPTLDAFLNELALVSDLDNYEEDNDSVALMTVHSAKGLEFNTVFIAGFEEGLFPIVRQSSDSDSEEERRLAYVAVTRAKKSLYLLHVANRMLYGRSEYKQISKYAQEIPPQVCDSVPTRRKTSQFALPVTERAESRNNYLDNLRQSAQREQSSAEVFAVGTRVSHAMFGAGEIISATEMGPDILYEIEFDNGSVKRLMGSYAKLKRL